MPVFSFEMTDPAPTVSHGFDDRGTLTIRSEREGGAHVLALEGELDLASAPEVEAELKRIEGATAGLAAIVIDLRGLSFIDSTGLRLLVEAGSRADTATYRLALLRPPDEVFRVCEIAGIDTLLPFEPAPGEPDA